MIGPELIVYAGQWIGLTESGQIAGTAATADQALRVSRASRPKERVRIYWVSPDAPHVLVPAWPVEQIRSIVQPRSIWIVGGTARDLLLNRTPHDWDFAVEDDALGASRLVADRLGGAFYALDAERGTGRVILSARQGTPSTILDFASLRGDGSIEGDLAARDFTINAMALTLNGQLVDPLCGLVDLQQGLLRETNDQVFPQDPVRLLRAVRLANILGYSIACSTESMIPAHAERLQTVAPERIRSELQKMLAHPSASQSLSDLNRLGLLPYTLPELAPNQRVSSTTGESNLARVRGILAALAELYAALQNPRGAAVSSSSRSGQVTRLMCRYQSGLMNYLAQQESSENSRAELVKWSGLFTGSASTADRETGLSNAKASRLLVSRRLESLRFATRAIEYIATCVEAQQALHATTLVPVNARFAHRYYRAFGDAGTGALLLVAATAIADANHNSGDPEWRRTLTQIGRLLHAYFTLHDTVIAPPPLLDGRDLLTLGIAEGPMVGDLLKQMREEQAAATITTREAAIAWVRERLKDAEQT